MVTETQVKDFMAKRINFIPTPKGNIGVTDIIDSQSSGLQRFLTLDNNVLKALKPITQYFLVDEAEQQKFHLIIANRLNEVLGFGGK